MSAAAPAKAAADGSASVTSKQSSSNGKLNAFAQQRQWRRWTAVNDEALRGLVNDPEAEQDRLWALAVLRSWGNPNEPKEVAVDPSTGKRLRQADFARELGVSEQTVSRWARLLAAQNRLYVSPLGIYPVDDPSQPSQNREILQKSGGNAAKYKKYLDEVWSTTQEGQEEAEYRAKLKTLTQKKLDGYKAWLKRSQECETFTANGSTLPADPVPHSDQDGSTLLPPYIKERARVTEEIDISAGASSSSSTPGATVERTTTTTEPVPVSPAVPEPERGTTLIREALAESGMGPPALEVIARVSRTARAGIPDVTDAEIAAGVRSLHAIRHQPHFGIYFSPALVEHILRLSPPPSPPAQVDPEEERRKHEEWTAALHDPGATEEEKKLLRRMLGMEEA